jgi:DNA-directed RNA polymerase specialized sigma24 family protein
MSTAPEVGGKAGRWSLSAAALDALLVRLDPDRDRAGERYEVLRARLVRLFGWRGCRVPDELADVTLDRVARRLAEGAEVPGDVAGFAHGVAMNVLREHWRVAPPQPLESEQAAHAADPETPAEDPRLARLDACLDRLEPGERELLLAYHAPARPGPGGHIAARQALALRLGLTPTALRIRAYRLRARLQRCLADAIAPGDTKPAGPA